MIEQDKREKVIKGLECCASNRMRREDCEAMDCTYLDLEEKGCIHQLIRDALALLKAQEPRVMTAEEVAALPEGAVAWLEERFDNVGKTFIQPMMSDGRGVMIGTHIRLSVRGISWSRRRFWTGKPGEDGERK